MCPSDDDSTDWIACSVLDVDADADVDTDTDTVSGRRNHVRSAFDIVL